MNRYFVGTRNGGERLRSVFARFEWVGFDEGPSRITDTKVDRCEFDPRDELVANRQFEIGGSVCRMARSLVEADSLAGLVDFAIDTDNSVIEAPDADAYYVRHDGYLYCYRPPRSDGGNDETADGSVSETDSTDGNGSEGVDTHPDEQ